MTLSPEGVAAARLAERPPPDFIRAVQEWLDTLATMSDDERWTSLVYVAGRELELPEDAVNEALRRALVVRAVGGDPQRDVELDETAVTRLAEELDSDERRGQLQLAIASLRSYGDGRPVVANAIAELLANPELAWRCYAAGLLAQALA